LWTDQSLDLRSLEYGLLSILDDLSSDDILSHIITLLQVEELSDLGSALRAQSARLLLVSQSLNLSSSLLHNHQVKDGQIRGDNASTSGLALALSALSDAVSRHAIAEEDAHTGGSQHSLLHSKALLVIATADLEHITSEIRAKVVTAHLVRDTLVIEGAATHHKPNAHTCRPHVSLLIHYSVEETTEALQRTTRVACGIGGAMHCECEWMRNCIADAESARHSRAHVLEQPVKIGRLLELHCAGCEEASELE
jgi:hypothetical protein